MPSKPLRLAGSAPVAPKHLSKRSQALWAEVLRDFALEATELEILRLGLEALDRCEQARELLAGEGLIATGRYGQKIAHPAVAIERDSRLAALRLFKQLGLENALELVSPVALSRRRRR